MLRKLGCVLLMAVLSGGVAFAQSTFGTILGTVTDATGAVISNATIKIINTDENTSRTLTTDGSGNYDAVDLKAGHYSRWKSATLASRPRGLTAWNSERAGIARERRASGRRDHPTSGSQGRKRWRHHDGNRNGFLHIQQP